MNWMGNELVAASTISTTSVGEVLSRAENVFGVIRNFLVQIVVTYLKDVWDCHITRKDYYSYDFCLVIQPQNYCETAKTYSPVNSTVFYSKRTM